MVAETIDLKLKNVLMVYSGGGYDGCIWEMNWCLWDANGEWHDVYSSGYSGLTTKEKAIEEYQWHIEHEDSEDYRDSKVMYVINLDKEDDFKCLQNYETVMLEALLCSVNEKLAELNQEMVAWFECTMCHKKYYPWSEEPGQAEYLSGNGGVGFVGRELLCPDCYSSHTCTYCGDYDEDSDKYDGYCEFCHEKAFKHFTDSLEVGSIDWTKKWHDYKGQKVWVAQGIEVTEPEDFDVQGFELEAADFKKPEKMDPDKDYLWVVESNGVDYFIRAKNEAEATEYCYNILGSCSDATAAWEAFDFRVDEEHEAARREERLNRR